MRKARIAEWILSLVTSPERAAATVGDLLEDTNGRGVRWFWVSVSRTVLSLLWRDLAADPLRMAGLGALGFLVQFFLFAIAVIPIMLIVGAVMLIGMWTGIVHWQPGLSVSPAAPSLLYEVPGWLIMIMIQYRVGRWIARRSPGRELAPCVAQTLVGLAFSTVIGFYFERTDAVHLFLAVLYQIPFLFFDAPFFAGAIVERRSHQRSFVV